MGILNMTAFNLALVLADQLVFVSKGRMVRFMRPKDLKLIVDGVE